MAKKTLQELFGTSDTAEYEGMLVRSIYRLEVRRGEVLTRTATTPRPIGPFLGGAGARPGVVL